MTRSGCTSTAARGSCPRQTRHGSASKPAHPPGSGARLWVQVDVEEAYIHCSKHVPRLAEVDSSGATDAPPVRRARTADYFGTAAARCDDASAAS